MTNQKVTQIDGKNPHGKNPPKKNGSVLRRNPLRKLRTMDDMTAANEEIFDAIESGRCTPKQIDGLNTVIKAQIKMKFEFPLRLYSLMVKTKGEIKVVGEELKKLAAG